MKLASGLLSALAAGLMTASLLPGGQKHHHFLAIAMTVLTGAAALFAASFLLPEHLAQLAQDVMCWFLVGTVAALALMATVKVLEGLLDS